MFFEIEERCGEARAGVLRFARGEVKTPVFMPVGTVGAVKAISPEGVRATGARMILGNAYHLMLRPGAERVARLGGLHRFMGWDGVILTDSGGFQIMSLASRVRVEEAGARFRSHIDGVEVMLSPERAMEVQGLLGSDVCMVLDECLRLPAAEEDIWHSVDLSLRWGERSKKAHTGSPAKVFGIVQGGLLEAARVRSAKETVGLDFDGYAVGGLSVGEGAADRRRILDVTIPLLPFDKPHYLMGVGRPDDLVEAIGLGVDMFDCVLPTREARHGRAYTHEGVLNLRNARFAEDLTVLDERLDESSRWSRAYVHHLFNMNEPLGMMILTRHNLAYFQKLMRDCRAAIRGGYFYNFQQSILEIYRGR